jgi:hypothetical protein
MRRTLLALTVVAGAVGGMTLAQHDGHDKGGVKTLSQKDITEKLDGKQAKATTVEVILGPARPARRTGTPARRSATSWRATTSGPSTTNPSRS